MREDPSESIKRAIRDATRTVTSAFLATHNLPIDQVPHVIDQVSRALSATLKTSPGPNSGMPDRDPAVPISASVKPDYLVCLEDGKKLKLLKRYLRTQFDLTPAQYRQRWGLPSDYPMVAPNYAKQRAEVARRVGLGKKQD